MNLQLQVSISLITKLLRLQRVLHIYDLHVLKVRGLGPHPVIASRFVLTLYL